MKTFLFACLITASYGYYADMDETLDIDGLIDNPVELRKYVDCALDKQPCTKLMEPYKNHIKDFFDTACAECDGKVKHILEDFFLNAFVKYPDELAQLRTKYDPDGTRFNKLVAEVAKF